MKSKQILQATKNPLALLLVGFALSSCAVLDAQPGAGNGGQSSSNSVAQNATNRNAAVVVSEADDNIAAEQQAIINEINRNGAPLQYDGVPELGPIPVETLTGNVVEFNYEQADLRLVLEELAAALDVSIVIDPTIDSKVSIRTSSARPLSQEDIWPLIRLLTRDAGVVLNRVGNVYNARKINSALPVEIATPDTLGQGTAARILHITPLTFISTQAAVQVIEPLLAPDG